MAELTALIETTRGGTLENRHYGALAVVNTRGDVIAHAGDAHWLSFTRSTLKALQALPFMESGGAVSFGFTQPQIAMMCASHSGEPMHVEQVQGMLDKADVSYKRLQCGCHVPYFYIDRVQQPPTGFVADERHNNCSGKHAGFVACCVHKGFAIEDYIAPDHPLQREIRTRVARAVRMHEEDMPMGIDGCSAPNYAMPLSRLALGYARLASGLRDSEFGESFAALSDAMTAHPELVSGSGRNDEAFMRIGRGDWVTKVGADAVQVVGSKSRGEAFALKIIDTNKPALYAATVAVLDQLGWLDDAQRSELAPWRAAEIVNAAGLKVGERKAVFSLQGVQG
jgi:L-asparaginase II